MITWSHYQRWLAPLLASPGLPLPTAKPAPHPQQLGTDSRRLTVGQWFVPLRGPNFDGHNFVNDVMGAQAAAGFFYEPAHAGVIKPELLSLGIAVSDTRAALQAIARGWRREQGELTVFALTGSVGKTTCKELLHLITSYAGPALTTRGNLNNEIGVPFTLLGLSPEHRFAVIEMGARQPGDIASLCHIAEPQIAACLNALSAHLEIFKTRENLRRTKLEILSSSPQTRVGVVNGDDPLLLAGARSVGRDLISFGRERTNDVCLLGEEWLATGGMTIHLRFPQGKLLTINLPVAHEAYPINVAAACAMAYAAGLPSATMADALATFQGVAGRYRIVQRDGLTVIDDTYNANPDSMRAGLTSLSQSYAQEAKVLVLGDMLELGNDSEYAHRKIGTLCQELVKPQLLITVGKLGQWISEQAIADGFAREQVKHFAKVEELLAERYNFKDWGKVIYAKASRGVQLQKLIESL